MNVLVIGSGGREHALCWRLAQSETLKRAAKAQIFCAPGNPGTASIATNIAVDATDYRKVAEVARREDVALTVVGPEAPLVGGIADLFAQEGLPLLGPTALAARLEGSKIYAKEFMMRHGIPTAPFRVFSDVDSAQAYIDENARARVVKADGLAAGKGVFVCDNAEETCRAVERVLSGPLAADGHILIEDRLHGPEVSIMVLSDGETIQVWESSQDHKAAFDSDKGPNTGGMGAYSPAPVLTEALRERVIDTILRPTIEGMKLEGNPYRGFLYAGLMMHEGEPLVLEYNCRLGDPETQPLMARYQGDLVMDLVAAAKGRLNKEKPAWDRRAALCVVMTAAGYPGSYAKGQAISGIEEAEADPLVTVFHAGTSSRNGELLTAGGRVLGVNALGDTLQQARSRAYGAVEKIRWEAIHYRKDIGWRAL